MKLHPRKHISQLLRSPLQTGLLVLAVGMGVIALLYARGVRVHTANDVFNRNVVSGTMREEKPNLKTYADTLVAQCAHSEYHPTCYDDAIPKLMDTLTMEQAFQVTAMVQDRDRSYAYCHVLGHKLSAIEVAKDPSKWKEVITRSPRGICSNGAIHGAFQERFRRESLTDQEVVDLKPELQDVCEPRGAWKPTGLEQGSCYHALGHLTMYITDGHIEKAVALCGDLALKKNGQADWRQLCYDGSFMQIFQPLEPDDFALVKGKQPTKEQLPSFCSKFSGLMRGPCWNEAWPLSRDQILTAKGLDRYCGSQFLSVKADIDRCYTALFYVVTAQLGLDVSKVGGFCTGLTDAVHRGACFANGAGRMIETDYRNIPTALDLCAHSQDAQEACYGELLKDVSYDFPPGSPDAAKLCAGMPEPWKTKCVR